MLKEINLIAPDHLNNFYDWYETDFAAMSYGYVLPIDETPLEFQIELMSLWLKSKGFKPVKRTTSEIIAIFKLL